MPWPPAAAGKSDLYVIRMKEDAIGVGHPLDAAPWYALDMTQWHNFKMDINPASQTGQLSVDGVDFGEVLVLKDLIPLASYNGIRWGDQGPTEGGIQDWAYVGWGADGQVPLAQFPNATGTEVTAYVPAVADFVEIALPTDQLNGNRRGSHSAYAAMPAGDVTLLDVPFSIPTNAGNTVENFWDSRYDSDGVAVGDGVLNQIVIDVNQESVSDVYTLIGTYAGAIGEPALAKLIFEATDGTIYEYELLGDRDIRNASMFSADTTILDASRAGNVWSGSSTRLDVQKVSLPAEWAGKTLDTVTMQDWGTMDGSAPRRQRSWLYGMTVEVVITLIPGDADGDGDVDDADATILAANWQSTDNVGWGEGDFNDDGIVDEIDATMLATNWQTSSAAGAVPEPGCLMLLLGLLLSFGCTRRLR